MRDQKLYESVGKYIDKYYIDKPDDIKLDKEMKSIFDRISEFRKKKATKKCNAEEDTDIEIDESAVESFDVESMGYIFDRNFVSHYTSVYSKYLWICIFIACIFEFFFSSSIGIINRFFVFWSPTDVRDKE